MARILAAFLAATLGLGCTTAYDTRRPARADAEAPQPGGLSPYGMELIGEDGGLLPTYEQGGRHYVLGEAGRAYEIRITNPTDHRIEAVVTVDGLDVIDGEAGDLRKRGYVVPAGGELRIAGFRTSVDAVATFRFSSVDASYAGRKGAARNVGVVAVALFDEVPPQEVILAQEPVEPSPPYDGRGGGWDDEAAPGASGTATGGGGEGARPFRNADAPSGSRAAKRAPSADEERMPTARPSPPDRDEPEPEQDGCCGATRRPGLGTEYGEQRYSAARWTKFVRAGDAPAAFAELRYNDAAGLQALGVAVAAPVDDAELTRRETADPFPGDPSFSRPPAGVR